MKTYNVSSDNLTRASMVQMEASMKSATIEFKGDGSYVTYSLDLDGKPETETGTWQYDAQTKILTTTKKDGVAEKLTVTSLTAKSFSVFPANNSKEKGMEIFFKAF